MLIELICKEQVFDIGTLLANIDRTFPSLQKLRIQNCLHMYERNDLKLMYEGFRQQLVDAPQQFDIQVNWNFGKCVFYLQVCLTYPGLPRRSYAFF